jgi:hypothetical protein
VLPATPSETFLSSAPCQPFIALGENFCDVLGVVALDEMSGMSEIFLSFNRLLHCARPKARPFEQTLNMFIDTKESYAMHEVTNAIAAN